MAGGGSAVPARGIERRARVRASGGLQPQWALHAETGLRFGDRDSKRGGCDVEGRRSRAWAAQAPDSLKIALEQLLGGTCHHMIEVFGHPEEVPLWIDAIDGAAGRLVTP